jgi:hypothetical protein
VAEGALAIGRLGAPAALQLRHQQVRDVGERLGPHRVGEVEPVDADLLDEDRQPIGDPGEPTTTGPMPPIETR